MSAVLKFAPFGTETDPAFWSSVANVKILEDKLEETTHNLVGMYDIRRGARPESSCRMMVHQSALTSNTVTVMDAIRCEGSIKNFNTLEAFKRSDKSAILHKAGEQIWDAIQDGTIYSIPSLLSKFTIVSFAELKKYKFYSWFAFPALRTDWAEKVDIQRPFNKHESTALVEEVGTYRRKESDERQHGFFLAKKVRKDSKSADPTSDSSTQIHYDWVIGTLGEYERGFFDTVAPENRYVCFVDPSTYDESPAWPIRNLLALVRYRWKWLEVQILCYRDIHARREEAKSIVIKLRTPFEDRELALTNSPEMPKVVGWMRTDGKLKATVTDLGAHMDPRNLADQAVDLNNKLMKWRIAPDLDLQTIKETKCLLLGAGTLGSYVARSLLGWGVRKITFVDNGKVSYSNPVRQPLFGFKDCLEGGVPKAERAAQALREIYPGVESEGYSMSVPMLGHPMMNEAATKEDFDLLKKLIDEHDVIFLLMDTRESRWLPTVMGKASGKIVLNAALGFDTYLVMRHGVTPINGGEAALGCYFCNDVVAPENSTKDATLDQQCTVTRPGAAPLAAAYLSELMVSILQHPLKAHAPAPQMSSQQSSSIGNISYERDPPEHPLGIIPHQIRGFMATFQNMLIKGQSYDCCSACSPKIVDAYNEHGFEFVKKALQQHDYVEELSGLAAVKKIAIEADIIDFDDSEEEEGDGVPVMI